MYAIHWQMARMYNSLKSYLSSYDQVLEFSAKNSLNEREREQKIP